MENFNQNLDLERNVFNLSEESQFFTNLKTEETCLTIGLNSLNNSNDLSSFNTNFNDCNSNCNNFNSNLNNLKNFEKNEDFSLNSNKSSNEINCFRFLKNHEKNKTFISNEKIESKLNFIEQNCFSISSSTSSPTPISSCSSPIHYSSSNVCQFNYLNNNFFNVTNNLFMDNEELKSIAVVHGKKNYHDLYKDNQQNEIDMTNTIKKFCFDEEDKTFEQKHQFLNQYSPSNTCLNEEIKKNLNDCLDEKVYLINNLVNNDVSHLNTGNSTFHVNENASNLQMNLNFSQEMYLDETNNLINNTNFNSSCACFHNFSSLSSISASSMSASLTSTSSTSSSSASLPSSKLLSKSCSLVNQLILNNKTRNNLIEALENKTRDNIAYQTLSSSSQQIYFNKAINSICRTNRSGQQFQYILNASTSIASKINEESMTYLNQGQSYEIRLNKLNNFHKNQTNYILKGVIKLGFQERRLQYMEKELLNQWKNQRLADRIVEIDIPLSYGVFDIIHLDEKINECEFCWNPNKETGLFIKINCISTEFTPKKHGGEKGVPFRLIIETHLYNSNSNTNFKSCIDGASCQIKVFKPKGADRKHKTDKEKMSKKSLFDQQKYLSSCDYTMFIPCSIENLFTNKDSGNVNVDSDSFNPNNLSTNSMINNSMNSSTNTNTNANNTCCNISMNEMENDSCKCNLLESFSSDLISTKNNSTVANLNLMLNNCDKPISKKLQNNTSLDKDLDVKQTNEWLISNRFDKYLPIFKNFDSNDLLNMSRNDLMQICDLNEAIRLYNCLHLQVTAPKLIIYVCFEADIFRAVYLKTFKIDEFYLNLMKIIYNVKHDNNLELNRIILLGPQDIKILVTEDVICNLNNESTYIIKLEKTFQEKFDIIMKPYSLLYMNGL